MAHANFAGKPRPDYTDTPLADRTAGQQSASTRVWRILGPGNEDTRTVIGDASGDKPNGRVALRKLKMSIAVMMAVAVIQIGGSRADEIPETAFQSEATRTLSLAREGSADAQFELAQMYSRGAAINQDNDEAYWWLRQAARGGHAGAQNDLGVIHGNGYLRARNDVEAYMWFEISAGNGDVNAVLNRRRLKQRMTDADVSAAVSLARDWLNWRTA